MRKRGELLIGVMPQKAGDSCCSSRVVTGEGFTRALQACLAPHGRTKLGIDCTVDDDDEEKNAILCAVLSLRGSDHLECCCLDQILG